MEKGAFVGKVDTVLLDGNQLRCDSQLDWFIDWLVAQKVRIFVPSQPEVKCAGPGDKEGTRLKDLMMKRNNWSADQQQEANAGGLTRGSGADPMTAGAGQMLANLIPGIHQAQGTQVGTQLLNSLASKYRMPGLNFLTPQPNGVGGGGTGMESVIDQFSEPIVKFASGMQPSPTDVNKLLQSLVNVPGFGNVDVSKLNPSLVEYVLKGGQIPGIPRETLTQIVKQYMQRLYVAAAQAQGIPTTDMPPLPPGTNSSRLLRPIAELPHGLVQSVMEGTPLPHLSTEQTNVIREYYTQHAPVGQLQQMDDGSGVEQQQLQMDNLTNLLSPKVIQMMQLLPRNYNLSKLPPDLVRQVMQGEMPDLTRLPVDLQQHIKGNFDRLIASLENNPEVNMDDFLKKLPHFEHPENVSTFSPYDINAVDSELVVKRRKAAEKARFWRTCAAVALGLASAVTLGVLSAFCWYWHRTGGASIRGLDSHSGEPALGLPSVVREQSFRPSANSTPA